MWQMALSGLTRLISHNPGINLKPIILHTAFYYILNVDQMTAAILNQNPFTLVLYFFVFDVVRCTVPIVILSQ